MVFEQLYTLDYLRSHPWVGFLMGVAYTIFGIAFAALLFPSNPSLIAVGLTAILLLPSLGRLTSMEEQMESESDDISFFRLWNINKSTIFLYTAIFLGSFAVFAFFALVLPNMAANTLFSQQLAGGMGFGGQNCLEKLQGSNVTFSEGLFWSLLNNNFKVLMLCFLISLIAGNGAVFLIIWNASAWGTFFAVLSKTVATKIAADSSAILALILVSVFPHMLIEMLSYILAAISGCVISDGFAKESLTSDRMRAVLMTNLVLLAVAIGVVVVGAVVETYVLNNFKVYATISCLR